MKWIAMTLMVALLGGAAIGCEAREEVTTPPAGTTPGGPAETDEGATTVPTTGPAATQPSAALTVSNQYCAVMGEHKVDPKVTVAHAGKTIGFCCEDCIPTFQKEPGKYLAVLK